MTYVEENNNEKQTEEKTTPIVKLKSPTTEKTVSKINDLLETEDKPQAKNNENQNYLFDLIDLQPDNNEKKKNNDDLLNLEPNESNANQKKTNYLNDDLVFKLLLSLLLFRFLDLVGARQRNISKILIFLNIKWIEKKFFIVFFFILF